MKSISTKLSVAMVCCALAAAILVGVINLRTITALNKESSKEKLTLTCENSAKELEVSLFRIEQSAELLAYHAYTCLTDESEPLKARMKKLEKICLSTTEYTEGAFTVYFHYAPERYDNANDFLYVLDTERNIFVSNKADDPRTYESETGEPADWYYASAKSMKPCWLNPYHNPNFEGHEDMVVSSYTVPVIDNENYLMGVVGIDFTMEGIIEDVENIKLYDSGYAFLVDSDMNVVYHPGLEFGKTLPAVEPELYRTVQQLKEGNFQEGLFEYTHEGEKKELYFSVLNNGMRLVVTVPAKEMYQSIHNMLGETYLLLAVVMIASSMIIFCLVYLNIRPLLLLDEATTQIIDGNMSVETNYYAEDEIGKLAENFRKMVAFLKEHISYINDLAYKDSMTGVRNKTAYENDLAKLHTRISQGFHEFGIAVFDLNNLKKVNDKLGHEAGDILIKNAAYVICKAFAHSPVYRIGGDEFVVLLENDDYRACDACVRQMKTTAEAMNETLPEEEKVHIAYGIARFDEQKDSEYSDAFRRADKMMYEEKARMKQQAAAAEREKEG